MQEDFEATQAEVARLKDSANKLTVSIFVLEARKGSLVFVNFTKRLPVRWLHTYVYVLYVCSLHFLYNMLFDND